MTAEQRFDHELDVRGLACPLPVIRARKVLDKLAAGEILKVRSSDPGSVNDFRALVNAIGLELLALDVGGSEISLLVRKP